MIKGLAKIILVLILPFFILPAFAVSERQIDCEIDALTFPEICNPGITDYLESTEISSTLGIQNFHIDNLLNAGTFIPNWFFILIGIIVLVIIIKWRM